MHLRISDLGPVGDRDQLPRQLSPGNQIDIVSVSPYVAGTMTTQVQMPQTGSATYNGSMMGNVSEQRQHLQRDRLLQQQLGLCQPRRQLQRLVRRDELHRLGRRGPGLGRHDFTGNFSGGGRSGNLSGAFFSSPTDAAKYQAGAFTIGANSTPYKAAGVFAGQR